MVRIQPNANFHSVTKKTVFDFRKDKEFLEYRRRWYEFPTNFIVDRFPIHLDIETTNVCNLYCPFCATTFKNWGPHKKGFLSLTLFKRIIDEGIEHGLCSVKLSFRGEPLLHPEITKMVAYAKKRGVMDVYFNTNATGLNEDRINQLIDSGLDRISISFEGIGKEVYQRYRVGANYESVVDNIKRLRQTRDKRNSPHPKIRIQTVLFPELKESFTEYVKFWQEIVDEVSYLDARKEALKDDHRGQQADWACPFLWQRMVILWDGTLLPCLMHGVANFDSMSLGKIPNVSIRAQWRSEKVNFYRKLHMTAQAHKIEACDCCSYRAMELDKMKLEPVKNSFKNGL